MPLVWNVLTSHARNDSSPTGSQAAAVSLLAMGTSRPWFRITFSVSSETSRRSFQQESWTVKASSTRSISLFVLLVYAILKALSHFGTILTADPQFDIPYAPQFQLVNGDGVNMQDAWREEPNLYLGITAPSYPNYFFCIGPGGTWSKYTAQQCNWRDIRLT